MPGPRLANKVSIITGAGSGIGLETSLLFATEGSSLILADINLEAAERTATLIQNKFEGKIKAIAVRCDVSKEDQVEAIVKRAVDEFGRLDVMFNNAGIMHPADDNALVTEEKIWDLTQNINVKGVWYGCKHAIIAMRQNPTDESKGLRVGGSVINTASFVGKMGAATPQLAYTTSKGAVLAMTRELAMIHAREGIRFNSLCPGPLKTPLLMDFLNTPEKLNRRLNHLPMGRFGEAIEQAKAVLFLASDDSSYVTGHDMLVDGGLTSAYVTAEGPVLLPPPVSMTSQF
ncbi:hypothetical protein HD553DRAFT_332279 [Filobasidium floriforme]|uniref:uncharacterized protein n=1 Tax=Filobasidium floriforme TaxID=5210 RepID=UPI001E8D96D8|nr:uncharacterized protein HD553DRAFT_332279 [Filobasidium floriforme]KAH8080859.1 hypothetical protein HD553DRAFT_332279 [Filobasidium floriforme]